MDTQQLHINNIELHVNTAIYVATILPLGVFSFLTSTIATNLFFSWGLQQDAQNALERHFLTPGIVANVDFIRAMMMMQYQRYLGTSVCTEHYDLFPTLVFIQIVLEIPKKFKNFITIQLQPKEY